MRRLRESGPATIHRIDAPSRRSTGEDLDTLVRRLDDGYARIESARVLGQDVTEWEEFWIDLLHQYEHAIDEFPEAA